FTLPIISQYPIFYRFIAQVFTHKGIYGHGASAVMDMREYSANLGKLLIENIPFILLLVTGIFFLIIAYIQRRLKELPDSILNDFSTRVLTAILLSQILGIIVVARHFKSKYLLPVLCLSPLLLYLLYFAREEAEPGKILPAAPRKQLKVAVVCFIIFSFVYTLYGLSQHHQSQSLRLQEAAAINEKLKGEYKNYCIIYYYNAPSEIFGLEFGHQWTPAFQEALLKIFGNHFFYNLNNRSFYSWSGKKISIEELKNRYNGRIVLFGNPFPRLLEKQNIQLPEFPIKDVFSGQFYTLYILEII
ncbi:MAG: hypothetical protein MUF15_27060, partial [Acidobacteria bacterium]|nr:hypothetical protein [Acidobacteriota bacterium]